VGEQASSTYNGNFNAAKVAAKWPSTPINFDKTLTMGELELFHALTFLGELGEDDNEDKTLGGDVVFNIGDSFDITKLMTFEKLEEGVLYYARGNENTDDWLKYGITPGSLLEKYAKFIKHRYTELSGVQLPAIDSLIRKLMGNYDDDIGNAIVNVFIAGVFNRTKVVAAAAGDAGDDELDEFSDGREEPNSLDNESVNDDDDDDVGATGTPNGANANHAVPQGFTMTNDNFNKIPAKKSEEQLFVRSLFSQITHALGNLYLEDGTINDDLKFKSAEAENNKTKINNIKNAYGKHVVYTKKKEGIVKYFNDNMNTEMVSETINIINTELSEYEIPLDGTITDDQKVFVLLMTPIYRDKDDQTALPQVQTVCNEAKTTLDIAEDVNTDTLVNATLSIYRIYKTLTHKH